MDIANISADELKRVITATERKLQRLKVQLANVEAQNDHNNELEQQLEVAESRWRLLPEEYQRYGRQMVVPKIGIQGQLHLRSASVLIVGVGGLGCPAAAYLAGAGIGKIGLVDGDIVELSNLHRQIIHNNSTIGMFKVDSAYRYLKQLNPLCQYITYATPLTPQNAENIVSAYDLILDCTDHPISRYLISDIGLLLQKPVISASALRSEGQLLLLNWPPLSVGNEAGGPCYRCIFPKSPPAESVVSCGDGGIIGPVVGLMGVLQAVEALKLLVGGNLVNSISNKKAETKSTMFMFSANSEPQFRTVKLKGRRKECRTCSNQNVITLEKLRNGNIDYEHFCGILPSLTVMLDDKDRLQPNQFARQLDEGVEHLLVDVREKIHFDICSLPGSINVPISKLQSLCAQRVRDCKKLEWLPEPLSPQVPIYIICRSGNDSQIATKLLKEMGLQQIVKNIDGGFKAWRKQVDPTWPEY
ncbi:putative molybdenum cofactor biosynthetic protein [Erysiphe necator]|uniref:Adenylyltransferase and sulfurtransferase uba4 n=1 Tax=Uncinula necator TaxID=52586 RepID=A0A0B1P610_UNCNE|nr:putative molybdenum cofactor biosynthetic protein [Erysiphe necator]